MTNQNAKIGITPEIQRLNAAIEMFDFFTGGLYANCHNLEKLANAAHNTRQFTIEGELREAAIRRNHGR